jgi:hypothetical protein
VQTKNIGLYAGPSKVVWIASVHIFFLPQRVFIRWGDFFALFQKISLKILRFGLSRLG